MAKSLKWRLVTIYILFVIIVMIVTGTLIVTLISNNTYQILENDLKRTVTSIKSVINTNTSIDSIEKDIKKIISTHISTKIYLLDSNGKVLDASKKIDEERFYTPMTMAILENRTLSQLDVVDITSGNETQEYRGYGEPVLYNGKVAFVIYALASAEQAKKNIQSTIGIILFSVLLAVVLAVVLGFAFSNFLTKPIIALTNKARDMSKGDLDNPIEVYSNDEIGELTQNFNIMANNLKDTLTEISGEKNKLETVFSHMTDGILVFDIDGKLIHKNPASIELLGTVDEERYSDIFRNYLSLTFEDLINHTKRDIIQHIIEVDNKYVNLCFAPYLDRNKHVMGNICVIQDITEHKKLEEMQKEFVANVSHELRTPLTTIKSYAETLLDGALDEKEIAVSFLQVINQEGDRMTALVQDLLELSRLDNKQTKFKMQKMNLTYVLEDSISKYQIHAEKKKQILNYNKSDKVYKIIGDPNRVEQVIKNIVSNAVKYSHEGATIDVSLYEELNNIIVAIKDSGMGIPKEDLSRIFERFYRVDKARSRAMGGTGLGLAIAKEIMEYHGGTISVESKDGEGTCFYLYFPYEDM